MADRVVLTDSSGTVDESLYDSGMATYDTGDTFDQSLDRGSVELWGLPSKMAAARDLRTGRSVL